MRGGWLTEISASMAPLDDSPRGDSSRMMVTSRNVNVAPADIWLEEGAWVSASDFKKVLLKKAVRQT